jgi:hypothetical protein
MNEYRVTVYINRDEFSGTMTGPDITNIRKRVVVQMSEGGIWFKMHNGIYLLPAGKITKVKVELMEDL